MAPDHFTQVVDQIWLVPLVREIVNPIILLLVAGAFVMFLWGVFNFIRKAGDQAAREEGRRNIAYGLAGLVIMFGAYGIINIALTTFNLPEIHKISTLATNQIGSSSGGTCADAGSTTGTGGAAADISTMVAGSAKVAANTGANSCAVLTPDAGDTYKEVALNSCSCSTTQGVVCCGEFPSDGQVVNITLTESQILALIPGYSQWDGYANAPLTSSAILALNSGTSNCNDSALSTSGPTSLSLSQVESEMKTLMTSCPDEVAVTYLSYPDGSSYLTDFNLGNQVSCRMYVPGTANALLVAFDKQTIKNNFAIGPGFGTATMLHTHPETDEAGDDYYALNPNHRDPPSFDDFAAAAAETTLVHMQQGISNDQLQFIAVAHEGLYTFNTDAFAVRGVPVAQGLMQAAGTDNPATFIDNALANPQQLVQLLQAVIPDINSYVSQAVTLQNSYLGLHSSSSQVSSALSQYQALWQASGGGYSLQPW